MNETIKMLMDEGYPKQIVDSEGNIATLCGIQQLIGDHEALYRYPRGTGCVSLSEAKRMGESHDEVVIELPNSRELPYASEKIKFIALRFGEDAPDRVDFVLYNSFKEDIATDFFHFDTDKKDYWTIEKAIDDVLEFVFDDRGIAFRPIGTSVNDFLSNTEEDKEPNEVEV